MSVYYTAYDQEILLIGVRSALALYKTALHHRFRWDTNDREKLLANKAALDTDIRNFQERMKAKFDSNEVSLENDVKRADILDSYRVKLLFSEKNIERLLHLRFCDSQEVKDIQ